MDTDFKISLGALGFVNVIGINDNEFAWNQGVLFSVYSNVCRAIENIQQFNGWMPVAWNIRTSVITKVDSNILSF